ncbi:MAG: nuclear transport factor 2 family protein [Candidatus Dadabacteria bacterium]|nr:MAG: nuclear transport factor 2 family protein [Candidatus Dadabacteria bacterium]
MTKAHRAIERLIYAYADAIDSGRFEELVRLLARAVLRAEGRVLADRSAESVARLYRSTTRIYEDGTPRTKHVVTNCVIDVDEERGVAAARSVYTVLQALEDFPLQPVIAGRYHDRFERDEAGNWHFAEREIFVDLRGDLSRHLKFDL